MKIFEILKKIDEQKKFFDSQNMIQEMADVESTKSKLLSYVNSEVLSKKDVEKEWQIAGNNRADFIEKIISLLSLVATKNVEEMDEYYDTQKLKTIFYLIANSNLELNAIAQGMHKSKVGYIPRYHATQKDKVTGEKKRLKDEEANTDLYHLLMNFLLYERGDLVHGLSEFFQGDYRLSPNLIEHDFKVFNNIYTDLFGSIPTELISEDLYKAIANMRGNASVTRGNFEFLFTLLFEGGCFEKMPSDKVIAKMAAEGKDFNKGDIKIGKNLIEVKVDTGSGGGRIGGQSGFNGPEGVVDAYQSAVKELLKYVQTNIASQIPKDNTDLQAQFADLLKKYNNETLQVNIVPKSGGKWEIYDTVLLEIAAAVQAIVGDLRTTDVGIKLREEVVNAYIKAWQSLILDKNDFQIPVKNIILSQLEGRSITDMIQSGFIINPEVFPLVGQSIAFLELAKYAALEKFHYMFVIKCDESFNSPKMIILSNEFIQKNAAEIKKGNLEVMTKILQGGIMFDLPATYKSASRAVRPAITLA